MATKQTSADPRHKIRIKAAREVAKVYRSLNESPTATADAMGMSVSYVVKRVRFARENGILPADKARHSTRRSPEERRSDAIKKGECPNHKGVKRAHKHTRYCELCLTSGAERTKASRANRRNS